MVTKRNVSEAQPLSALAFLSHRAGGKHSITQEALHNLFVNLSKENTVKHYHSCILLGQAKIKLIKMEGVVTERFDVEKANTKVAFNLFSITYFKRSPKKETTL